MMQGNLTEIEVFLMEFQCRKQQCYDARARYIADYERYYNDSFNAASSNAMMQVIDVNIAIFAIGVSMPQAAML